MKKLLRLLILGAPYVISLVGVAFAISPPFSTAWDSTYESIPADTEQESLGASRIRDLKQQLRLRLSQDLSWAGDGNDGFHNKVTLLEQASDPISQLDGTAVAGILYSKNVGGISELFFKTNTGVVNQITTGGAIASSVPAGAMFYTAGSTAPAGYVLGTGQAISRTGNPNLFSAIGTIYGSGDGSTTFNVPDCRARYIAGLDPGNATGRMTAAVTGGVSASSLDDTGGEQFHVLTAAEAPILSYTSVVHDPGHSHTIPFAAAGSIGGTGSTPVAGTTNTSVALTGITVTTSANAGGGAHNLLPPTIVENCIIKAG